MQKFDELNDLKILKEVDSIKTKQSGNRGLNVGVNMETDI